MIDVDRGEAAEAALHGIGDEDRVDLLDPGGCGTGGETAGLGTGVVFAGVTAASSLLDKGHLLLFPRMPWGRKMTISISTTPITMYRTTSACALDIGR